MGTSRYYICFHYNKYMQKMNRPIWSQDFPFLKILYIFVKHFEVNYKELEKEFPKHKYYPILSKTSR